MAKLLKQENLTDKQWEAIINNDAYYDQQFYYAVKSTGIFCRPSCKSRPPKRENIHIYLTAEEAMKGSYRPCKRCRPTGERIPDLEWITIVTAYIDRNYMNQLSLDHLADISHSSPYHLHRTFKRIQGMTPVEYIQQQRIMHAQNLLITTKIAITDIGSN